MGGKPYPHAQTITTTSSPQQSLTIWSHETSFLKSCSWLIGRTQQDVHCHYRNEMQVHIDTLVMLLQRGCDEVAVVAFCWELACWQAAYPQERAEGPFQLHKAAELMATVMAWLHLGSREFDCRSAAWPLALAPTTWNYCNEGRSGPHMHMTFGWVTRYILCRALPINRLFNFPLTEI